MVKLAVLGLDAMTFGYLNKLTSNGVMSYVGHILSFAFKAKLYAFPPITLPSWTSIMIGLDPSYHGIYAFFKYDRQSWKQRLYTALDLRRPRIHEILSFIGLKSIVFNPIPDYPVIPVNNATVISNLFFTPKPLSYPKDGYRYYFGNFNPLKIKYKYSCEDLVTYQAVIEAYLDAVEKTIEKDPELLWVNLNIPDFSFIDVPDYSIQKRDIES